MPVEAGPPYEGSEGGTTGAPASPTDPAGDTGGDNGSESGSEAGDGSSDGGEDTGDAPPPYYGPAVYPAGQVHSPLTDYVADNLRDIAQLGPALREDVFLKAGASSTVSYSALHCFSGDNVDLGEHDHLEPTLSFFLGGDAAGTDPFDRATEAAQSGRGAGWCISGSPSPLQTEVTAVDPRIALVHYGTNDMNFGVTYASAAYPYYANMNVLLDSLIEQGIIPVVFGITHREDSASANRWVATYNAINRGLAQARQIPFIDMFEAIDPLPNHGLSSDGLHLQGYDGGPCVLTSEGLEFGYNMRNLISLQGLDRAVAVLVDDVDALDDPDAPPAGDGTAALPHPVFELPFSDTRDTTEGEALIDAYPACDDADEGGPELWYSLELDAPTAIRAMVLDLEGVDVDLHLLDGSADPGGCLARGDRLIEGTLDAGTYHLVVDSWGAADSFPGDYLLVVVECDADDVDCAGQIE